jgi:hypothetical protein
MSEEKTGGNSGRFQKGDDPRRGVGKPGRSGRKPLEFTTECARLSDEEVLPKLAQKLAESDPSDPAWRWAAQTVLEYSKQKVAQGVNLASADGETIVRVIRKAPTPTPIDADDD